MRGRFRPIGCAVITMTWLMGCGEKGGSMNYASVGSAPAAAPAKSPADASEGIAARFVGGNAVVDESKGNPPDQRPVPRKIIYNAQVDLVVENVATTGTELLRLVKEDGGYLSETEVHSYTHLRRSAMWKVRIPVDKFDDFLKSVERLGEVSRNQLDSQDVTQEYYDVEARISNKQQEEKRLLKHLADSTGKLEDILAVERELSRVRGEIEQSQGRLRYLANQTALSTVTIQASEIKDYTPPVAPTFAAMIGRTFGQSVATLTTFGKNLVLVVVAVAPWLPLVLIAFVLLRWVARRLVAGRAARTA